MVGLKRILNARRSKPQVSRNKPMNTIQQDEIIERYSKARDHMLEAGKLLKNVLDYEDQKQPIIPIVLLVAKMHGETLLSIIQMLKTFEAYKDCITTDGNLVENYEKMSRQEISQYCSNVMLAKTLENNRENDECESHHVDG